MSNILTLAKELPTILSDYHRIYHKRVFILSIIIVEIAVYFKWVFTFVKLLSYYYIEWWLPIVVVFFSYLFWLIDTKRLFFRDGWWIPLWSIIYVSLLSIYPLWIYPQYVVNSRIDLPYIQIWGIPIIAIVFFFVLKYIKEKCNIGSSRKMIIVFYVDNSKINIENTVCESIKETIANIGERFSNIEIVVPPFGCKVNISNCTKYINNPFMQADALIYARVVDGNEDGRLGCVFTKFTSRVNTKRHINYNNDSNELLNKYLEQQRSFKEWNNLNIDKSDITSKIKIANNLEGMLLMYCSALYMLKNDYTTALPIAKQMYSIEQEDRNSPICRIAQQLLQFSYFASAKHKEHITHDYRAAHSDIEECVQLFPSLKLDSAYMKAMARISFFLGDIKASKSYTKSFKNSNNLCGYYLNMGFYAMYENKVGEYISHYKNLIKQTAYIEEIKFAVEFLKYQLKISKSEQYNMLLELSVAILTGIFIDNKKGIKLINVFERKYSAMKHPGIEKFIEKTQFVSSPKLLN